MTRYRKRPEEVDAIKVPERDPLGKFLKWSRGRRVHVQLLYETGTTAIAFARIEQLGDFPQYAPPGDYVMDPGPGGRIQRVSKREFERDYVRC